MYCVYSYKTLWTLNFEFHKCYTHVEWSFWFHFNQRKVQKYISNSQTVQKHMLLGIWLGTTACCPLFIGFFNAEGCSKSPTLLGHRDLSKWEMLWSTLKAWCLAFEWSEKKAAGRRPLQASVWTSWVFILNAQLNRCSSWRIPPSMSRQQKNVTLLNRWNSKRSLLYFSKNRKALL